jgi:hypothetical protein
MIFCNQMESVMWNSNSFGNIDCTVSLELLKWKTQNCLWPLPKSCPHKQFDNENITYNDAETACVCVRTRVHAKDMLTDGKDWGKSEITLKQLLSLSSDYRPTAILVSVQLVAGHHSTVKGITGRVQTALNNTSILKMWHSLRC